MINVSSLSSSAADSISYRLHDAHKRSLDGAIDKSTFSEMFGSDGMDINEWTNSVGLDSGLFYSLADSSGMVTWDNLVQNSALNTDDGDSLLTNHDLAMEDELTAAQQEIEDDAATQTAQESLSSENILKSLGVDGKTTEKFVEVIDKMLAGINKSLSNALGSDDSQDDAQDSSSSSFNLSAGLDAYSKIKDSINGSSLQNLFKYINLAV
ncbi:hypothetical protein MCHI_002720 [Candidatus Magnetoovum chiemensis]|nr:hypothetical protein MCHI_002720 [Candidatus Magnetoovum chiemensis]